MFDIQDDLTIFKNHYQHQNVITPAIIFKQDRRAQITDHTRCRSNFTEEKGNFPIPSEKIELYYKEG